MKAYAKILLYTYPLLEGVGEEYEEHIRNQAVLSYRGNKTAQELAEYLAGEILEMRNLEWLKSKLEEALTGLGDEERQLLRARYFSQSGKRLWGNAPKSGLAVSERTYFRRLKRAEEKMVSRLTAVGLTEAEYKGRLAELSIVKRVAKTREKALAKKQASGAAKGGLATPPFRTGDGGAALG